MLERRGGAGKNWSGWRSRVCWGRKAEPERIGQRKFGAKQLDEVSKAFAEAEPQKLGLDGGAVRVGKTWRSRKGGWQTLVARKKTKVWKL